MPTSSKPKARARSLRRSSRLAGMEHRGSLYRRRVARHVAKAARMATVPALVAAQPGIRINRWADPSSGGDRVFFGPAGGFCLSTFARVIRKGHAFPRDND